MTFLKSFVMFDAYAIKNVIIVIFVVVAAAVNVNGVRDVIAVASQISYISSYHGGMTFLKAIGCCCIIICTSKAIIIVNIAVDVVMYVSNFCCCVSTY
jgi:hypothetical protein